MQITHTTVYDAQRHMDFTIYFPDYQNNPPPSDTNHTYHAFMMLNALLSRYHTRHHATARHTVVCIVG